MGERKSFLLRLPPDLLEDLNRWARDELRSLNAQIEYVLREAIRRQRRSPAEDDQPQPGADTGHHGPASAAADGA